MSKVNHVAPAIKLSFVNPQSESKSVLGKGVVTLMRNIEEDHSLNKAAKRMNMAYSKALGCELVESVRPTGSCLTEEGRMLLELYENMEQHLRKEADDYFLKLVRKI